MKYYHGSRNGNLTKLDLEHSNDGYVWMTPDYAFAVLYGANSFRCWRYNHEQNKLVIYELAPNCLQKMYKGKPFYIYSTDDIGEFEDSSLNGRQSVKMKHDVVLKGKEYIPDAYEKIMQMYKDGEILIDFWEDYTEEEKQKKQANFKRTYTPEIMLNEKLKFPEEYALIVDLIPEMAVD